MMMVAAVVCALAKDTLQKIKMKYPTLQKYFVSEIMFLN